MATFEAATFPVDRKLRHGPRPSSTMMRERTENDTLEPCSVADFVAFMAEP